VEDGSVVLGVVVGGFVFTPSCLATTFSAFWGDCA